MTNRLPASAEPKRPAFLFHKVAGTGKPSFLWHFYQSSILEVRVQNRDNFVTPMPKSPIFNYLRTHRKRLGLSQEEVAFLLGVQSGAKICRYERIVREPTFKAAIAFELIFQRPVREVFKGLFQEIADEIAPRARKLLAKYENDESKRGVHKLAVISKMVTALSSH